MSEGSKCQRSGRTYGKNVPINVGFTKSTVIVMMRMTGILRTSRTRSSHCFIIENWNLKQLNFALES